MTKRATLYTIYLIRITSGVDRRPPVGFMIARTRLDPHIYYFTRPVNDMLISGQIIGRKWNPSNHRKPERGS